ncbi:MAG: murein transglycosylase A [Rhodocyclales bacterium]|nr:murein transglycosylase A [Rhodocyclales bacterium]
MLPRFLRVQSAFPLLTALVLAACSSTPIAPVVESRSEVPAPVASPGPVAAPPAATRSSPPLASVPSLGRPLQPAEWSELPGWNADALEESWPAFMASCRGLARQPVWQPVCEAGRALGTTPSGSEIRRFFEGRFSPWRVLNQDGTKEGLITGYYEPLIRGSRAKSRDYNWPVIGVPDDLLNVDLSDAYPELKGLRVRGRMGGHNKVVPYYTRAEINRMPERFAHKTLLYAADPIELFFMQVQGSGRVQLPDGSLVRLAYGDTNGYPYQSIGRWLVDKGELKLEQASMDGIKNWVRANPARLNELLAVNPSYIFFKEVPNTPGGPVGALGQPLTEGRSMAVDPRSVPLGAPVFLSTTNPLSTQPLQRLMMAQDTGSAIKGGVRGDFFWGFGLDAGTMAGRMRQKGEMWVLWPRDQTPR